MATPAIARLGRTKRHGSVLFDQSCARSPKTGRWSGSWLTSFVCCGRRSRSPPGFSILTQTMEACNGSHETIYRSLFIQARGALKRELLEHLRRTRGMRRSRSYTQKTGIHGQIVNAVPISERPAAVEDRAVPGHWEGDLVFGSSNSQIATLVERQTRYVMLVKLDGKDSQTVVNAPIKHCRRLPQELYKSLTWDRGTEMHGHERFPLATDIQVYFCDPQSPWQRGSNENTNGLLSQYLPKGIDLSALPRRCRGGNSDCGEPATTSAAGSTPR